MEKMERETHIIDAKNKVLGRLASEIVILLSGKHKLNFLPYKDMGDFVIVKNVKDLKLNRAKLEKKKYFRHSGYLGGLKEIPLKRLFQENPGKVLKKVVFGMLPKNRLRAKRIKRLKVED